MMPMDRLNKRNIYASKSLIPKQQAIFEFNKDTWKLQWINRGDNYGKNNLTQLPI